jgi:hypothetical protein
VPTSVLPVELAGQARRFVFEFGDSAITPCREFSSQIRLMGDDQALALPLVNGGRNPTLNGGIGFLSMRLA